MKGSLAVQRLPKRVAALGMIFVALLLFLTGMATPAEAAQQVTLQVGQKVKILTTGCDLTVTLEKVGKVRVVCTGGIEGRDGEQERVNAPDVLRTLSTGQKLIVLASGCKLEVTKKTADKVIVRCKAATPPIATVIVDNLTGGTLCYEIFNTGIGEKCFGSGLSQYGSFPAGTYNWAVSADCGTDGGTLYYAPKTQVHWFKCDESSAGFRKLEGGF
jgi:hypothetical protein